MTLTNNIGQQNCFNLVHTLKGHSSSVYSITFCDGYLYSASSDKLIARWNIQTGEPDNFSIKLDAVPYIIKAIPEYSILIIGLNNGLIHIIDLNQKTEITSLKHHASAIFSIEINSIKGHIYIGDKDGNLSAWNINNWENLFSFNLDCGKIRDLKYVNAQNLLIVAKYNGEIGVYETEFYNEIKSIAANKNGVSALAYNADERLIISGGKDAHIRYFNFEGQQIKSVPAHNYVIYGLETFNEAMNLSCSRDGSIKVWDRSFSKVLQKIDHKNIGHKHSVNEIIIIDNDCFASCSDDKLIKIFRLSDDF